jgi:hypothetical protein
LTLARSGPNAVRMGSENPHPNEHEQPVLPQEPRTPMWLPMLGGVALLITIILFVVLGSDEVGQQSVAPAPSTPTSAPAPEN